MRAMLVDMLAIAREPRLIFLTLTSMVLICAQFALMGFFTLTLVHHAGYPSRSAVGLFTLAQLVAAIGGQAFVGMAQRPILRREPHVAARARLLLVALVAFAVAFDRPRRRRCGSPR